MVDWKTLGIKYDQGQQLIIKTSWVDPRGRMVRPRFVSISYCNLLYLVEFNLTLNV
jgi:hypothetical protein